MSDIADSILQYLRRPNTDYAYLLTGPWGSGKTYFWKHTIAPQIAGDDPDLKKANIAYVPLYGISDCEDIGASILCQAIPKLGGDIGNITGGIAGALLDRFNLKGFTKRGNLPKLLSQFTQRQLIICVDDLERTHVRPIEVLGYINQFVEHSGAKAVILCNEPEVERREPDEYMRTKEKLIRISRQFSVDMGEVLSALIDEFASHKEYHHFLQQQRSEIARLFAASESHNLRVLKYSLSLLYEAFEAFRATTATAPGDMSARALPTLLPVAFEHHLGRLNPSDVKAILAEGYASYARLLGRKDKEASPLDLYFERYVPNVFTHPRYESKAVAELVINGTIDHHDLAAEVALEEAKQSPERLSVKRLHADWYEMEDAEFKETFLAVIGYLRAGKIRAWNDLMQVVRVCAEVLSLGWTTLSENEVRAAFSEGIDALQKNGFERHGVWSARRDVMLRPGDGALVQWLANLLQEVNIRVTQADKAAKLEFHLKQAGDDASDLGRFLMSQEADGVGDLPLSGLIDAASFVRVVLDMSNRARRQVAGALDHKYERMTAELVADRDWLETLVSELDSWLKQQPTLKSPSRYAIERIHAAAAKALARVTVVQERLRTTKDTGANTEDQE